MNRKSGDLPGYASRFFFDGKEGEGPRRIFFISATLPFSMKRGVFFISTGQLRGRTKPVAFLFHHGAGGFISSFNIFQRQKTSGDGI